MNQITPGADFAAECHGIRVPNSPFLHDKRIERINAAAYEGDEIAGALSVVRKGDRVLELGAGLGIVGAVVAARAEPERVLSFEANPALIRHIRRLHRINGLTRRIELRNEVLVGPEETRTTLPFHIRSSYLGSSLHSTGRAAETVNVVTAPLGEVTTPITRGR